MCGIVVQASFRENALNKNLIHEMAKDIVHRGPDDEGYFFNSLVIRLVSIIFYHIIYFYIN